MHAGDCGDQRGEATLRAEKNVRDAEAGESGNGGVVVVDSCWWQRGM